VELDSGREIRLSELHLESTYTGLIEGYPVGRAQRLLAWIRWLHYSRLVVVWFQDDPVLPSGSEAAAGLRGVRWEQWAQDVEI
jgi:hypothetical protein